MQTKPIGWSSNSHQIETLHPTFLSSIPLLFFGGGGQVPVLLQSKTPLQTVVWHFGKLPGNNVGCCTIRKRRTQGVEIGE